MWVRIFAFRPSLQIASQSDMVSTTAEKLTEGLTSSGLLRSGGTREFDVLHTERVECLGNGNLGLGIEEGIGELFALCVLESVWR